MHEANTRFDYCVRRPWGAATIAEIGLVVVPSSWVRVSFTAARNSGNRLQMSDDVQLSHGK